MQTLFTVDFLLGLILLAYPALLFLVRGGMNGSLFLITIISVSLLISHRKDSNYSIDDSAMLFGFAMTIGLMGIFISQLYHHDLKARYFDSNTRFLLAVPVLLALRHLNVRTLAVVQYAFPLGAIAAFTAVMTTAQTERYEAQTSFMNSIHLGDMALLLGFLSVFSINWVKKDGIAVKLLKLAGLLAGMAVSVVSGARGGWIAVPVLVVVYVYVLDKRNFGKKMTLAVLALGMASVLAYFLVEPVHHRLWMIYSDLDLYSKGTIDTSIGIRLQLWKAAFHLIAENPILGAGADGFARAMDGLSASGFITPTAADLGKGEVHNEILAQTVRSGIFGLCSILAIYFVPFSLFYRAAKSAASHQKTASMMGMCVTLGFFIFGLTVETFDLKMTAAFYSLTVTVLLAMAIHKPGLNDPGTSVDIPPRST